MSNNTHQLAEVVVFMKTAFQSNMPCLLNSMKQSFFLNWLKIIVKVVKVEYSWQNNIRYWKIYVDFQPQSCLLSTSCLTYLSLRNLFWSSGTLWNSNPLNFLLDTTLLASHWLIDTDKTSYWLHNWHDSSKCYWVNGLVNYSSRIFEEQKDKVFKVLSKKEQVNSL